jgi:glutamate/tyrosine decarboxylase-like PLP-dependent enzyme
VLTFRFTFIDEATGEEEYREIHARDIMTAVQTACGMARQGGLEIVCQEVV